METKLLEAIKRDSKAMLITLAAILVIFKIVFYKESILAVIWAVVSFFLTFTIPGFILCYLWHDKLDFIERFVVGNMLGLISVGILSYNISVYTGLHIKYISILSPILVAIIFGTILYFDERKNKNTKNTEPTKSSE